MPYLIDGHNLIPKIPGLSLESFDDELQLVEMLLEFCRRRRKRVEVFFDQAPIGFPRLRNFGSVVARFVPQGQTADDAIRNRLSRLGRQAREWTVVSSDQSIQATARAVRAHYLSSEVFANEIVGTLANVTPDLGKHPDTRLSEDEIDTWLDIFESEAGGE